MTTVLLLESAHANGTSFAPHLEKRYTLLLAHDRRQALTLAAKQAPQVLIVDAASLKTSGDRICAALKKELHSVPLIHIKAERQSAREKCRRHPVIFAIYLSQIGQSD